MPAPVNNPVNILFQTVDNNKTKAKKAAQEFVREITIFKDLQSQLNTQSIYYDKQDKKLKSGKAPGGEQYIDSATLPRLQTKNFEARVHDFAVTVFAKQNDESQAVEAFLKTNQEETQKMMQAIIEDKFVTQEEEVIPEAPQVNTDPAATPLADDHPLRELLIQLGEVENHQLHAKEFSQHNNISTFLKRLFGTESDEMKKVKAYFDQNPSHINAVVNAICEGRDHLRAIVKGQKPLEADQTLKFASTQPKKTTPIQAPKPKKTTPPPVVPTQAPKVKKATPPPIVPESQSSCSVGGGGGGGGGGSSTRETARAPKKEPSFFAKLLTPFTSCISWVKGLWSKILQVISKAQ